MLLTLEFPTVPCASQGQPPEELWTNTNARSHSHRLDATDPRGGLREFHPSAALASSRAETPWFSLMPTIDFPQVLPHFFYLVFTRSGC